MTAAAVRVLAVLPGPPDEAGARFAALRGAATPGGLEFERLADCTENGLRQRLAQGGFQVLHFIGRGKSKAAAHYAVLELDAAGGGARAVNGRHLGSLLAGQAELQLVVLQPSDPGDSFAGLDSLLHEQGVAAVLTTAAMPALGAAFAARLYQGLLAGTCLERAYRLAREVLLADPAAQAALRLVAADLERDWNDVTAATAAAKAATPQQRAEVPRPVLAAATADTVDGRRARNDRLVQQAIADKRAAGRFDVFLCHNSVDKPAVKAIGQALKSRGLLPWLDEWELPPGQPWQPLLERQIGSIRSAAVFVGRAGVGPWQEQEMYGLLNEFVVRRAPVIPSLLPDAASTPTLPIFLKSMTYVDFRLSDPDPMARLEWGITGVRPDDD